MVIKNLVLSGGSYNGLKTFGVLKYLHENGFYDIKNIENIYATSVCALIATILVINLPIEHVYDFIVKRPWDKAFNLSSDMLFNMITEKGIIDKSFFLEIFKKLFKTADIPINITMKKFYDITHINLHFFSVKVNAFELIEISHLTHPNLSIIDAVYMSCSIPFIVQPMFYKNSYMIDGAVLCNFPLKPCIDNKENTDDILAINIINSKNTKMKIDNTTNLLKYGHYIFDSLVIYSNRQKYNSVEIKNLITIESEKTNFLMGYKLLQHQREREKMIAAGYDLAKIFLQSNL